MPKPLCLINNLTIKAGDKTLVDNISFKVGKSKIFGIVGESGSGKSLTALSCMGLLAPNLELSDESEILFEDNQIHKFTKKQFEKVNGNDISMIFQEPMTALNPLHKVGKQIAEVIKIHNPTISKSALKARVLELLDAVELETLRDRLNDYPHQLSGGQRQRIMIAMAIANNPKLLIADEPTTALDATVQLEIIKLLQDLKDRLGISIVFISHDLNLVKNIADNVAVMCKGKIIEQGTAKTIFEKPKQDYTKNLIKSALLQTRPVKTKDKAKSALKVKDISVSYPLKKNFFGQVTKYKNALEKISFNLKEGFTLGIVGESGSGKTTIAFRILNLISGFRALVGGEVITKSDVRMVFQDPYSALSPRMKVIDIISEGLESLKLDEEESLKRVKDILKRVNLAEDSLYRYPHEFSGGQRQRVALARALVSGAKVIILDEPTSALDVTTQNEILALLKDLQKDLGVSYIFITHDMRVIKSIAHEIIVLKQGKLIEKAKTADLFKSPKSDFSKSLIKAANF